MNGGTGGEKKDTVSVRRERKDRGPDAPASVWAGLEQRTVRVRAPVLVLQLPNDLVHAMRQLHGILHSFMLHVVQVGLGVVEHQVKVALNVVQGVVLLLVQLGLVTGERGADEHEPVRRGDKRRRHREKKAQLGEGKVQGETDAGAWKHYLDVFQADWVGDELVEARMGCAVWKLAEPVGMRIAVLVHVASCVLVDDVQLRLEGGKRRLVERRRNERRKRV